MLITPEYSPLATPTVIIAINKSLSSAGRISGGNELR